MPGTMAVGPLAFPFLRGGVPGVIQRGLQSQSSGIFAVVSWNYTLTPTVGGSVYSRPKFTITLGSVNDYGVSQIQIVNTSIVDNNNNPQTLTVARTFNPGDQLIVDSDQWTVKVNGVVVDYAGQFILLDPRAGATNTIKIYVQAKNAPTLTPVIDWTPRWLS